MGRPAKLSPDIVDDLIYIVLHKAPTDFEFIGRTWTCTLLAMWSYIKAKLYRPSSRSCIEELILDTKDVFDELNSDINKIDSLAYARKFLV